MQYLETLKNIKKDKLKKKENLFFILALLVILLISTNYIFSDNKEDKKEKQTEIKENTVQQDNDLEGKIEKILNEIGGITDSSVIINYSDNGENTLAYNTKETLNDSGNTISVEKSIAYNESSGTKNAIIQLYNTPRVEGVVIVACGVESAETKQKIATAIGNLLGVASFKVQVFEK